MVCGQAYNSVTTRCRGTLGRAPQDVQAIRPSACSAQTLPSPGRTLLLSSHTTRRSDAPNAPRRALPEPLGRPGTGPLGVPQSSATREVRHRTSVRAEDRRTTGDHTSSDAERPAQAGTTGLHVVTQPHRPGQQLGLHALGSGPTVLGRRRSPPCPSRTRNGGDSRDETGVDGAGRAVASSGTGNRSGDGRLGSTATAAGRRLGRLRRTTPSGHRDVTSVRSTATTDGRELRRLGGGAASTGGRAVLDDGEPGNLGQAGCGVRVAGPGAPAGRVPGHGHLLGGRATQGRRSGDRQVPFREAERGQVGPGRLLDTAEDHPDPHLAGTIGVVPPAQQLARPPGTGLIDLDRLGLAGEHGCSVLHHA